MNREYLESLKKENLIEIILQKEEKIKELEHEIDDLRTQIRKSKFEDYIYDDYINTKELLESEHDKRMLQDTKIRDLNELLDRYQNIVDRLGVKNTY